MANTIQFTELKSAYAQSLGDQGAEKILVEAIRECGLRKLDSYPMAEAQKICSSLKAQPGFIGMISKLLLGQFATRACLEQAAALKARAGADVDKSRDSKPDAGR